MSDIYAAGEERIRGYEKEDLVRGLHEFGNRNAIILENKEQLAKLIKEHAEAGDLVICLGAGTITSWANELPKQLENLFKQELAI